MKTQEQQVFTFEVFNTGAPDFKVCWCIHSGSFEQNRDFLSPEMYWARSFSAASLKEAKQKARILVETYRRRGADLRSRFCPFGSTTAVIVE